MGSAGGCPSCPMLRPRFRKPHRLCRPDAALKNPISLPSLRRGRAQLSRRLVAGSGVRRKGVDAREPWPFWEGWVGRWGWAVPSPVCWREQRGGVEGREAHGGHRMGKEYTHWQGRKREGGRPSVREPGLFRGRKTTQLSERQQWSQKRRGVGHHATTGTPRQRQQLVAPLPPAGPGLPRRSSTRASTALAKPSPPAATTGTNRALS